MNAAFAIVLPPAMPRRNRIFSSMTTIILNKYMHGLRPEPSTFPMEKLSNRKRQMFQKLGHGKMTHNIAKKLGLSSETINPFRHRMIKKLVLKNYNPLVLLADRWTHEGKFIKNILYLNIDRRLL